jgi:AcrR family transcriptional regulator
MKGHQMASGQQSSTAAPDREEQILDAVLALLARAGISGVTMRAVAREAGVALGLINYHFQDKTGLIAAALRRMSKEDVDLVLPPAGLDPEERVRHVLGRVADDQFLRGDYLAVRLQLWALSPLDPLFASINRDAQLRYRDALAHLIADARPHLAAGDITRRATEIVVVQNGMWLTALVLADRDAVDRSLRRCEELALGPDAS